MNIEFDHVPLPFESLQFDYSLHTEFKQMHWILISAIKITTNPESNDSLITCIVHVARRYFKQLYYLI